MRIVVLIARVIIGGIFVYASIHKIMDPAAFAASVRNYLIIPASWSHVVALTLPWVEAGAGAFLILGIQIKPSAVLTTGMLAIFLAAIIRSYAIGLDIDCGCFSSAASASGHVGIYHIVRDFTVLCVSTLILVFDRGDFGIASVPFLGRCLKWANA